MTEQEKIIKGLGEVSAYFGSSADAMIGGTLTCDVFMRYANTTERAIVLLKSQEPMLVVSKDTNEIIGDCPRCGRHVIHWHNKYCSECGQAVKWE